MKPYCEVAVQNLLPSVRALIAKDLIEKHKLTQQSAAEKLGTSQAAISQYYRAIRGSKTAFLEKDKDVKEAIQRIAGKIASGEMSYASTSDEFCEICKLVRKKKLICEMHKSASPKLLDCKKCL
ncbi:MAG: transcriptional regulator [Nanoarchaeota archaeon]|nr:transcriptional regulator [Nanoarchaeota archaeon]MBU4124320.1 transcriptional regulator [Nanoarchaeota archaeon]